LKRRSILGMTGASVAVLALAGSALAANGFTNGSLEGGPAGSTVLSGGSTAIPGWTVTGTDIDYTDLWQTEDGAMSLDLNGFGPGGIKQSFATTLNNDYVVHFWMSGNPGTHAQFPNGDASPDEKTMTVQATGGPAKSFSFDTRAERNTFGAMKWVAKTYSFKATGATTTLTFDSTTGGAFGPALDDITMTETVATGAHCKNDGWKDMRDASGTPFKNQGACVSFYAKSGTTPIGPS
jgi:choice-of-anchor C domain-containing protein